MKRDISYRVAELLLKENKDLLRQIKTQEAEIAAVECKDPRIGKWVDLYDVPYLLKTLSLADSHFSAEYPALKSFTSAQREELSKEIQGHIENCKRCELKSCYDLEWDVRVANLFYRNKLTIVETPTLK